MNGMNRNGKLLLAIAVAALVVAAGLVIVVTQTTGPIVRHTNVTVTPRQSAPAVPTESAQPYVAPTQAQIAALPEAMYSAVIPGLMAYTSSSIPLAATYSYTVAADIPIYGSDRVTPVARFAAENFMLLPSVIVPVKTEGPWSLVMTPARQQLPSKDGGHAPAQTVGWVRTSALIEDHAIPQHIVVSVSQQSVSIVNANGSVAQKFPAGVGTPNTPTPTGVVGYLEARYVDPPRVRRCTRFSSHHCTRPKRITLTSVTTVDSSGSTTTSHPRVPYHMDAFA
jgi:hypothetical protein